MLTSAKIFTQPNLKIFDYNQNQGRLSGQNLKYLIECNSTKGYIKVLFVFIQLVAADIYGFYVSADWSLKEKFLYQEKHSHNQNWK